ncbi:MAG: C2H2-type zinc finger protein [Pyrinomonadaceae bacterium]
MSGNFKCPICRRSFSSIVGLKNHRQEHQKPTRHCNNCGINYSRLSYHRC